MKKVLNAPKGHPLHDVSCEKLVQFVVAGVGQANLPSISSDEAYVSVTFYAY